MTFRTLLEKSEAFLRRSLLPVRRSLQRLRALRPATRMKVALCVGAVAVFAVGLAVRGDAPTPAPKRTAHARAAAPDAGHKGESHGLAKLIAQTRAPSCAERTEAAKALAGNKSPKAVAALHKLASATFKDESASPGIFSCNSRRAAQKALGERG